MRLRQLLLVARQLLVDGRGQVLQGIADTLQAGRVGVWSLLLLLLGFGGGERRLCVTFFRRIRFGIVLGRTRGDRRRGGHRAVAVLVGIALAAAAPAVLVSPATSRSRRRLPASRLLLGIARLLCSFSRGLRLLRFL